ncbi:MAG: hypothetical protein RL291_1173 [Pseudomonadota bacterium]|jgi:hypothetical protein
MSSENFAVSAHPTRLGLAVDKLLAVIISA